MGWWKREDFLRVTRQEILMSLPSTSTMKKGWDPREFRLLSVVDNLQSALLPGLAINRREWPAKSLFVC